MQALQSSYPDWQVHYSNLIVNQDNYLQDAAIKNWLSTTGVEQNHLHLATSVRSFRSEKVSAWVHALLDTCLLYTSGGVSYLFIKAGLVLFNSSGQSEINQLSIWSLAFLSGLNAVSYTHLNMFLFLWH